MKTESDEVFEETAIKISVMGRPLGLAIIAVLWVLGGLMAIIVSADRAAIAMEVDSAFPEIYWLFSIAALALGAFLILIGIGLWKFKRRARFIAMCSHAIVIIYYIVWTISGFMDDISGVYNPIRNFITVWSNSLILHLPVVILFLISLVYLRLNHSWFKQFSP